jgi:RimJ/RimL family protein N-acetyltransferase
VLPQYQGLGASVMLYAEAADTLLKHGFEHVDVVQVGAENFKSRSAMEALGVEWYKRHRVYEKDLGTV